MKHQLLLSLLLFSTTCWAVDRDLLDAGEFVEISPTPTVETKLKKETPGFERLLERISIEPSQGSWPASFIVSGRVVSGNSGGPLERISVLIGLHGAEPRLAALTNVDGDFKFRLWIKKDQRDLEIQVPEDFSGFLYIGGSSPVMLLGTPALSTAHLLQADYRRYALKRLLELSKAPKK